MKIYLDITNRDFNIFWVSDLHLWHKNVILFDNRPFGNVIEMNSELIKNWNSVVSENDIVFYLGDLSFAGQKKTKEITDQLNGKIHFILGNHDKEKIINRLGRFETISDYVEAIIIDGDKRQQICMMHYPILSWNRSHHNSWMLHGHCHGSLMENNPEYYKRKVMDVGCANIDYTPISYDEVMEIMSEREIINVDHN